MLFLSDLDFTLLKSDTTLGSYTKEVWNRANKKAKLSVATARSFSGVNKLLKGLELTEPLILLDGSIIAKPNGKILHMAHINKNLGNEIIELSRREFKIEPIVVAQGKNQEEFYYPKELNKYQKMIVAKEYTRERIYANGLFRAQKYNLKIVYQTDAKTSKDLELRLKETFGSEIETKRSDDPYYNCFFLTVLNPLGDKAHALKKLEEIENISIDKTTVFGDSHNDLGLFEVAGRKIAVANAIEELKQKADIVLPHTNDQEGVAKYLETVFKIDLL